MRNYFTATLLAASLLVPVLVGCDREVEKTESVKTSSDGTQVKESKTVKETPDGSVVTEHKKDVDHTNNP